jgi:hypothetical protein
VLRNAVNAAKIDRSEKLRGLNALGRMAQLIEKNCDPFADTDQVIAYERRHSHEYGGMTVKGPAKPLEAKAPEVKAPEAEQLDLFGEK